MEGDRGRQLERKAAGGVREAAETVRGAGFPKGREAGEIVKIMQNCRIFRNRKIAKRWEPGAGTKGYGKRGL